jgi:hypothetical protein
VEERNDVPHHLVQQRVVAGEVKISNFAESHGKGNKER